MYKAEAQANSTGIGFVGLLTILFVGLKLTGFIDWSWWWVLSPIWIMALVYIGIIVAAIALYVWLGKNYR